MVTGTTQSGFNYEVEDEVLDDYELLELLNKADEGEGGAMLKAAERLLGEKQKEALKNHVRNEKGKVSAKRMIEEVFEILKSQKKGKN